uniref:GH16 domain-containing protein n=1 Tax=Timema bartmani TaxID=61472 RepID=A0A7R9EWX0_9NEOP|nr:unnamed protein product [Timema bartmani]
MITSNSFAFKYGILEIRAKLPEGDWLWPAMWLLPKDSVYGGWPRSGEIDMIESRGNRQLTVDNGNIGVQQVASTLHWGPSPSSDAFMHATASKNNNAGYASDFHVYRVEWTKGHAMTMEEDRMPEKALQSTDKGKTLIGRPRTRWMPQVQKYMEAKGTDWRCVAEGEVGRDRKKWILAIHSLLILIRVVPWATLCATSVVNNLHTGDGTGYHVSLDHMRFTVDGDEIGSVYPSDSGFYGLGQLDGQENPWGGANNYKMAPFDQQFYIILNMAVGGNDFFPDNSNNPSGKPWSNTSPTASSDFWNARAQWLSTWQGDDAHLQVDYVKVFAV